MFSLLVSAKECLVSIDSAATNAAGKNKKLSIKKYFDFAEHQTITVLKIRLTSRIRESLAEILHKLHLDS